MKKWIALMTLGICLICLVGCSTTKLYRGEYPELQSIGRSSLLGVRGRETDRIMVLEEDDFGRKMFSYVATVVYEGYGASEPGYPGASEPDYHYVLAILISQKTTSERAYFYDGVNYIYCKLPSTEYDLDWTSEDVLSYFTTKQVEELKARNDWNSGEATENCFSVEVSRVKPEPIRSEKTYMLEDILRYNSPGFYVALSQDRYGKIVCLLMEHDYLSEEKREIFGDNYIVMLNSDSELYKESSVHKLSDIWDCTQELYDFKVANDWCFTSEKDISLAS